MKRFYTFLFISVVAVIAVFATTTVIVNTKDGGRAAYAITDVDSIDIQNLQRVTIDKYTGGTVKMYCGGKAYKSGDLLPYGKYVTFEIIATDSTYYNGNNIYKGLAVKDSIYLKKDTVFTPNFIKIEKEAASEQYRICNYNIRLYTTSDTGDKFWTKRKSYLFAMINRHAMDVCGIEEFTSQQYNDFKNLLTDYEIICYGRDNGKEYGNGGSGEGTALVYRKNKFLKLDQGRFFLSNTPTKPSKVSGASFNRMVTWVKLQERESGNQFYFFATHFDHPVTQTGINTRSKEADIALKIVPTICGTTPMFFVGDFNCRPEEPAYQKLSAVWKDAFITMGDDAQGGYVCNPEQLKRPGLAADCACKGNTYTGTYNESDSLPKRIDYVLYNETYAYPTSYLADGDSVGYTRLPSDHLPIITEMKLK